MKKPFFNVCAVASGSRGLLEPVGVTGSNPYRRTFSICLSGNETHAMSGAINLIYQDQPRCET